MDWFILFGRKYCKVCSTATMIKRDGKYVCVNVNHAANVARAAQRKIAGNAAGNAATRRPGRTTRTGHRVVLCPACLTPMNRFMIPVGLRHKCMNPAHARKAAIRNRRRRKKQRMTWKKKK